MNSFLSQEQKLIVRSLSSRVEFVQGPPGTGKSTLICAVVECTIPKNKA